MLTFSSADLTVLVMTDSVPCASHVSFTSMPVKSALLTGRILRPVKWRQREGECNFLSSIFTSSTSTFFYKGDYKGESDVALLNRI